MDELSINDAQQQYSDSLVMVSNRPAHIQRVWQDGKKIKMMIVFLEDFSMAVAEWGKYAISAPDKRLGMVNHVDTAVWMTRRPVRRYKVGFAKENIKANIVQGFMGDENARNAVVYFNSPGLHNAIMNIYPDIQAAYDWARECQGCWAFDKQFAIDHQGQVYYKDQHIVGYLTEKKKNKVENIKWSIGNEHLSILLGGNCENTFRALEQSEEA